MLSRVTDSLVQGYACLMVCVGEKIRKGRRRGRATSEPRDESFLLFALINQALQPSGSFLVSMSSCSSKFHSKGRNFAF